MRSYTNENGTEIVTFSLAELDMEARCQICNCTFATLEDEAEICHDCEKEKNDG